jgi:hypothetical protein
MFYCQITLPARRFGPDRTRNFLGSSRLARRPGYFVTDECPKTSKLCVNNGRVRKRLNAALFVAAEFDLTAFVPAENNPVGTDNDEFTGDEAGMAEFAFGDLAFATQRADICPPGYGLSRDIIIACNLDGLDFIAMLANPDDFIKMSRVKPNPLTGKFNLRFYHTSNLRPQCLPANRF